MPVIFKQNVNQWLGIALISLMCFWVVLYYLADKANAVGNQLSIDLTTLGI